MNLPPLDTLESAYRHACFAQRGGRPTIMIIVKGEGQRGRSRHATPFGLRGVSGLVVRRFPDERGVIERIQLMCDTVDIIAAYEDHKVRALASPIRPQRRAGISTAR